MCRSGACCAHHSGYYGRREPTHITPLAIGTAGTYQPRDNAERLAELGICQFKGRRTAEAGLLAAAFAADPTFASDVEAWLRYRVAREAAVAGCGGGVDGAGLSDPEGVRWRKQAASDCGSTSPPGRCGRRPRTRRIAPRC